MGDGIPYLDIVFFAMVALFLLLRLRSVLGRRTGTEKPPPPLTPPPREERDTRDSVDKVVALPERRRESSPSPAVTPDVPGLAELRRADPSLDPAAFLEGARSAYEMIVGAFAAGDAETLRPLLAEPVYQGFAQAIAERKEAGRTVETTIVGIKDATLAEGAVVDRRAEVTVRFTAELINVTRDAQGAVVDGNPSAVHTVTDLWTFARELSSRDPNWQLIRTGSPA